MPPSATRPMPAPTPAGAEPFAREQLMAALAHQLAAMPPLPPGASGRCRATAEVRFECDHAEVEWLIAPATPGLHAMLTQLAALGRGGGAPPMAYAEGRFQLPPL